MCVLEQGWVREDIHLVKTITGVSMVKWEADLSRNRKVILGKRLFFGDFAFFPMLSQSDGRWVVEYYIEWLDASKLVPKGWQFYSMRADLKISCPAVDWSKTYTNECTSKQALWAPSYLRGRFDNAVEVMPPKVASTCTLKVKVELTSLRIELR
jgi:hypothetical protein